MNNPDRIELSKLILAKLEKEKESLKQQYQDTQMGIGYFYIDHLLPKGVAEYIYASFPKPEEMSQKKSLREYKHVAAQMDQYDSVLEEIIYAFQQPAIVKIVSEICGIEQLFPDENLYAGGISLMAKDNFLNPHLDNSHDKDRNQWRVLNLLFYITPNWEDSYGGHLELWPNGLGGKQVTLHSRFNRLTVMATHQNSWHSVSPVVMDGARCCVSNYYFSPDPLREEDRFHVTTFRGRPSQKIRTQILKVDSFLRMGLRKIFKKGIRENPHVYKKK